MKMGNPKKTLRRMRAAFVLAAVVCSAVICPLRAECAGKVTWGRFLADLVEAYETGCGTSKIDADVEALHDEVAASIAAHWKNVYLDPDYRLYIYGQDDPAELPVTGAHAFVVLGYELMNGEMTDELKGRCEAAAAAARAFPDSILVCSGGATGKHNPRRHTEAGMMKAYLTDQCGIEADRIFIDERAKNTADNAVNTFAILRKQKIETMTIVTSAYHQRWGQVLYNAYGARYEQKEHYQVQIAGNFCYDIEPSEPSFHQDDRIAIRQLGTMLKLPKAQMDMLPKAQ